MKFLPKSYLCGHASAADQPETGNSGKNVGHDWGSMNANYMHCHKQSD